MVYDKGQKTVQACFLLSICRHNNLASLTHLFLISSLRGFFFFFFLYPPTVSKSIHFLDSDPRANGTPSRSSKHQLPWYQQAFILYPHPSLTSSECHFHYLCPCSSPYVDFKLLYHWGQCCVYLFIPSRYMMVFYIGFCTSLLLPSLALQSFPSSSTYYYPHII